MQSQPVHVPFMLPYFGVSVGTWRLKSFRTLFTFQLFCASVCVVLEAQLVCYKHGLQGQLLSQWS